MPCMNDSDNTNMLCLHKIMIVMIMNLLSTSRTVLHCYEIAGNPWKVQCHYSGKNVVYKRRCQTNELNKCCMA